jgi:rhodanese-related sulfurtransferase
MLGKVFPVLLTAMLMVGVVLTGACAGAAVQEQVIQDIAPVEAHDLIERNRDNPDFVILDVRTPEEFSEEHIEGAVNIDFYSATFRDQLDKLDKDKTYLVYCRSGGRSGNTMEIMEDLGFQEAYNVLDGILGWKEAGLPTVK